MSSHQTTKLERESLEAHVDLCAIRYENLDNRLTNIEGKVDSIHNDIQQGQQSMTKVLIGATGTIIAGLLSTIIVVIMNF